jgi:hypothetical protein
MRVSREKDTAAALMWRMSQVKLLMRVVGCWGASPWEHLRSARKIRLVDLRPCVAINCLAAAQFDTHLKVAAAMQQVRMMWSRLPQ